MVWFKVDDGMHSHPKTITAGTAAIGLWTRCGSWSEHHLTDGMVPAPVALSFGTTTMIRQLVAAGLWEVVEGGYQFHDFEDYNPLAVDVKAERDAAKERQRNARDRAKSRRDAERSSADVTRDKPVTPAEVPEKFEPPVPEGSKEPLAARKRAVPPPESMPITDEMRDWAAEHAPDVRLVVQTAKLLDWARGKGEKKQDWVAAWRNWMRSEQERITERTPAAKNGTNPDREEIWMRG